MFSFLRDISARHERLKERIHAFRLPLSPTGQKIMGLVYFCIPIIGGYYIMQAAIAQSYHNLGARGEKLLERGQQPHGGETRQQNKQLQTILDKHASEKRKP